MMPTIQLNDDTDRWRWTCPAGHRSWEPTNHHFWCQQCAKIASDHGDDVDPVFHKLRDQTTGNTYERDEVTLMTPAGPYGRGSA